MTAAVLYSRSSKDRNDISPAAQRSELRAYADRKGYRVVGDFSDAAVSANANRGCCANSPRMKAY